MLGGLLFGIATFRAGILPRWAAGLLAVTVRVDPSSLRCFRPSAIQRLAAMPDGVSSGLPGLCALVRTARASIGTLAWQGKPPALTHTTGL